MKKGRYSPSEIKTLIEQSLDADKAFDIVTIDLNKDAAFADYMIIASGTSSRHISAIAEKMKERLSVRGLKEVRLEGVSQSDWVVVDAGDVVVHLFRPEVREFYNMEKMWCAVQTHDAVGRQIPA
ncbi:MAG TPA: ribosome silencing factor [Rhodospirillaceae bacterium]|nr:ribosome silencing factor [Rhodospirillaceae bacterium]